MAVTPKKTPATNRKAPATVGATARKGVALTARQALKAAQQATGEKPVAKPAAKAPALKAKPLAAKAAAPKVIAPKLIAAKPATPAPVAATPIISAPAAAPVLETPAPVVPPKAEPKIEEVIIPLVEMKPEVDSAVHTAIAEGKSTMNDVIANTKKYTEEAKTRFQSAYSDMNEKAKASVEKSTKAMEEMTEIAKGNVEALVESGKIAAKGIEAMGQEAAEYGRLTFEKASATMKSLAAAKSPTEFFQLQSEMLSTAFDVFAKESAKTSEAMIKLAGDVAQPISSRVSVVTEKVKSLAA